MAQFPIKVTPNARQSELIGWIADADGGEVLRIKLRSPPVDGKANRELIAFLSGQFGIPKGAISIVRGEKSRTKTIAIEPLSIKSLRRRIDDLLA